MRGLRKHFSIKSCLFNELSRFPPGIADEHKVCEVANKIGDIQSVSPNGIKTNTGRIYVRGLVSMLGEGLQKYWKIGLHWLTVLKKSLLKIFDVKIALILSNYQ